MKPSQAVKTSPAAPLLVDARAAAARLGVSHTWLKKQVTAGAVQHTRVGRLVKFSEEDIAAFVGARTVTATSTPRRGAA